MSGAHERVKFMHGSVVDLFKTTYASGDALEALTKNILKRFCIVTSAAVSCTGVHQTHGNNFQSCNIYVLFSWERVLVPYKSIYGVLKLIVCNFENFMWRRKILWNNFGHGGVVLAFKEREQGYQIWQYLFWLLVLPVWKKIYWSVFIQGLPRTRSTVFIFGIKGRCVWGKLIAYTEAIFNFVLLCWWGLVYP